MVLIICLWFSICGLYVDVATGGIWSEGPQRFLFDPAHPTELQQRHLGQHEHSGCVQLGKHDPAEQPVWAVPRSDSYEIKKILLVHFGFRNLMRCFKTNSVYI